MSDRATDIAATRRSNRQIIAAMAVLLLAIIAVNIAGQFVTANIAATLSTTP